MTHGTSVIRWAFALSLAAAAAGCASGPAQLPVSGSAQLGAYDAQSGRFGTVTAAPPRQADSVAISVERAWELLPELYASLDLPATVRDTASLVTGVANLRTRRPIGREPLSRALECGLGATGPNADSYEVHLTVLTAVHAAGTSATTIETSVSAWAVPNGNNTHVTCASTGRLEERIAQALRSRL